MSLKKEPKIIPTKPQEIYVSVKTGQGMHLVEQIIKTAFESDNSSENINSEIKKIRHWIKKSSLRKNEIRENNSNIKSWSI